MKSPRVLCSVCRRLFVPRDIAGTAYPWAHRGEAARDLARGTVTGLLAGTYRLVQSTGARCPGSDRPAEAAPTVRALGPWELKPAPVFGFPDAGVGVSIPEGPEGYQPVAAGGTEEAHGHTRVPEPIRDVVEAMEAAESLGSSLCGTGGEWRFMCILARAYRDTASSLGWGVVLIPDEGGWSGHAAVSPRVGQGFEAALEEHQHVPLPWRATLREATDQGDAWRPGAYVPCECPNVPVVAFMCMDCGERGIIDKEEHDKKCNIQHAGIKRIFRPSRAPAPDVPELVDADFEEA